MDERNRKREAHQMPENMVRMLEEKLTDAYFFDDNGSLQW